MTKYPLFLAILSFFIYCNTLNNDYAYDDFRAIGKNIFVTKGVSSIPELLATPYHYGNTRAISGEKDLDDLYRPLSLVMFAVEYQIAGLNPFLGHFMNLLVFAACVASLFVFLEKLFKPGNPTLVFTACLLFVLHPIHTEVVANIKSRDELLCFLFAMLMLIKFLNYHTSGSRKQLYLGLLFFSLSLLSKETSITLLGVVGVIFYLYRREKAAGSHVVFVSCFSVAAIYLLVRFIILIHCRSYNPGILPFIENQLVNAPSYIARLATAIYVLGSYLRLLFIPYPLVCDYSFRAIPFGKFTDIGVITSLLLYLFLLGFVVYRFLQRKNDPLNFGISFFIITISIFSNLFILVGAVMAERFMFFPSAGFCIAVAYLLDKYVLKSGHRPVAFTSKRYIAVVGTIGVVYGGIAIDRNKDWKDNTTLFATDSQKSPDNCRLLAFTANQMINQPENGIPSATGKIGNYGEAIELLRHSLAIYPENGEAMATISDAFLVNHQPDSAVYYGLKALAITPHSSQAIEALAGGYMESGRYRLAIPVLHKAMAVAPDNPNYAGDLGSCFMFLKQYDSAVVYFQTAWLRDPALTKTAMLLSVAFRMTGQPDSMHKYEAIVRQKDPRFRVENVPLSQ